MILKYTAILQKLGKFQQRSVQHPLTAFQAGQDNKIKGRVKKKKWICTAGRLFLRFPVRTGVS